MGWHLLPPLHGRDTRGRTQQLPWRDLLSAVASPAPALSSLGTSRAFLQGLWGLVPRRSLQGSRPHLPREHLGIGGPNSSGADGLFSRQRGALSPALSEYGHPGKVRTLSEDGPVLARRPPPAPILEQTPRGPHWAAGPAATQVASAPPQQLARALLSTDTAPGDQRCAHASDRVSKGSGRRGGAGRGDPKDPSPRGRRSARRPRSSRADAPRGEGGGKPTLPGLPRGAPRRDVAAGRGGAGRGRRALGPRAPGGGVRAAERAGGGAGTRGRAGRGGASPLRAP